MTPTTRSKKYSFQLHMKKISKVWFVSKCFIFERVVGVNFTFNFECLVGFKIFCFRKCSFYFRFCFTPTYVRIFRHQLLSKSLKILIPKFRTCSWCLNMIILEHVLGVILIEKCCCIEHVVGVVLTPTNC